jgi:hypothetical protein
MSQHTPEGERLSSYLLDTTLGLQIDIVFTSRVVPRSPVHFPADTLIRRWRYSTLRYKASSTASVQ